MLYNLSWQQKEATIDATSANRQQAVLSDEHETTHAIMEDQDERVDTLLASEASTLRTLVESMHTLIASEPPTLDESACYDDHKKKLQIKEITCSTPLEERGATECGDQDDERVATLLASEASAPRTLLTSEVDTPEILLNFIANMSHFKEGLVDKFVEKHTPEQMTRVDGSEVLKRFLDEELGEKLGEELYKTLKTAREARVRGPMPLWKGTRELMRR